MVKTFTPVKTPQPQPDPVSPLHCVFFFLSSFLPFYVFFFSFFFLRSCFFAAGGCVVRFSSFQYVLFVPSRFFSVFCVFACVCVRRNAWTRLRFLSSRRCFSSVVPQVERPTECRQYSWQGQACNRGSRVRVRDRIWVPPRPCSISSLA